MRPNGEAQDEITLVAAVSVAHERLILACDWARGFGDAKLSRLLEETERILRTAQARGAMAIRRATARLGGGEREGDRLVAIEMARLRALSGG